MTERHLAQALGHVRAGEAHLRRQAEIVEALREADQDTAVAADILDTFRSTLALHKSHLQRILARRDRPA